MTVQTDLVGFAQLRVDDVAIFSQEEMGIRGKEFPVKELGPQLIGNGMSSETAGQFIKNLLANGFAELRRPRLNMWIATA